MKTVRMSRVARRALWKLMTGHDKFYKRKFSYEGHSRCGMEIVRMSTRPPHKCEPLRPHYIFCGCHNHAFCENCGELLLRDVGWSAIQRVPQ